jgi:hypothetical protein
VASTPGNTQLVAANKPAVPSSVSGALTPFFNGSL